jgi:hypothetical protein
VWEAVSALGGPMSRTLSVSVAAAVCCAASAHAEAVKTASDWAFGNWSCVAAITPNDGSPSRPPFSLQTVTAPGSVHWRFEGNAKESSGVVVAVKPYSIHGKSGDADTLCVAFKTRASYSDFKSFSLCRAKDDVVLFSLGDGTGKMSADDFAKFALCKVAGPASLRTQPPAQAATGPGEYVTKSGYLAALTEEDLDTAVRYAVDHDEAALKQLVGTGAVFVLKAGLRVVLVDTHLFGGKAKIRPRGQMLEVWVPMEAIGHGN